VLVIDEADRAGARAVEATGVRAHVTRTLMRDRRAARRLAEVVLGAGS
jgi:hypothetical protein